MSHARRSCLRLAAVAAAALSLAAPARGAAEAREVGTLVATATATGVGCATGSDRILLTGVSDEAGHWTFSLASVRASADVSGRPPCLIGGHEIFDGAWSWQEGGYVKGLLGDVLNLGPVPARLTPQTTTISVCLPAMNCASGTATVIRS